MKRVGVVLAAFAPPYSETPLVRCLGVVPRDVVDRREAGVAPPMPPCGRR